MPATMTSSAGCNTKAAPNKSPNPELSPRQHEILSLLQEGKANKEIAYELGIGLGTVKQHVVALFKKLNVTNRAMAVSKGFTLKNTSSSPSNNNESMLVETALERRPVTVLNLVPAKSAKNIDQDFQRRLYRTLTDVAFDFGAIFFARRDGGGDMIFGVERTRIHDVLRAVRAATAVATDMAAHKGDETPLCGGLSCGVVMASMNRLGAWSGEAIVGAVIASTRELSAKAKPGRLALGESALQLIRFLGAEHRGKGLKTVPLTNPFQWRLCSRSLETPLRGRKSEMKSLINRLAKLSGGVGGVILLEGESGIGKSALLWSFMDHCAENNISVLMKACPAPDSQPSTLIAGSLIEPGSSNSLPVSEFEKKLAESPPNTPMVIMIDDTHLLPQDAMSILSSMVESMANAPILFVLTSRGRSHIPDKARDGATVIHLKRLAEKHIAEILNDWFGDNIKEVKKVSDLAVGVPVFTIELARHLRDRDSDDNAGEVRKPEPYVPLPLSILALVIARIDTFQLDRHLLRLVAKKQGKHSRENLLKEWQGSEEELSSALDKTVRAGLLFRNSPSNGKKETYSFRHPMVQAVVSFALSDY